MGPVYRGKMTLASTTLYDDWIELLIETGDISEETAQQIVDLVVGDPRIAFARVRTDSEVESLRSSLKQALDEFDLTEYGNIEDHDKMRDSLLSQFDSHFAGPEPPSERSGTTASASFSSESEEYDRDDDSIYMEVEETNLGLQGAVEAGGEGDPANEDVTPRESELDDEEIWDESSPDRNVEENSQGRHNTDDSTETTSSESTNAESDEQEDKEDKPPLSVIISHVMMDIHRDEINEELTPPLEVVEDDLLKFSNRSTQFYRILVRDTLFGQYEDEKEREAMFWNLVESHMEAQLNQMLSDDKEEDGATDEERDTRPEGDDQ